MSTSDSMIRLFIELGEQVESSWRALGYDESKLPLIAEQTLQGARLHQRVGARDLLGWVCSNAALPEQLDPEGRFGQPPVTVYSRERFVIDALFWFDGTTAIHDHGFSGAFCVLHGSSLHSSYTFEPWATISSRFVVGDLRVLEVEVLRQGDVRVIQGGTGFIHALFHLDRPSVSIVIRSRQELDHRPQHVYLPPHLRVSPRERDRRNLRRIRALRALLELDPEAFWKEAGDAISGSDPQAAFEICHEVSSDAKVRDELLHRCAGAHGHLVEYFRAVLAESAWEEMMLERRFRFRDADHRFFLGVLIGAPTRDAALRLVASRYGGDPVAHVTRWLRELASLPSPVSAAEPNALCLLLDEATLDFIEVMLRAGGEPDLEDRRRLEGIVENHQVLRVFSR